HVLYTLSLHDALPIYFARRAAPRHPSGHEADGRTTTTGYPWRTYGTRRALPGCATRYFVRSRLLFPEKFPPGGTRSRSPRHRYRSEEHTSELQSPDHL